MKFTPGEWRDLQNGFEAKQRSEQRNIAWAVANLMNVSGNLKKAVTIESLFKDPEQKKKRRSNTVADIDALARRCGGK